MREHLRTGVAISIAIAATTILVGRPLIGAAILLCVGALAGLLIGLPPARADQAQPSRHESSPAQGNGLLALAVCAYGVVVFDISGYFRSDRSFRFILLVLFLPALLPGLRYARNRFRSTPADTVILLLAVYASVGAVIGRIIGTSTASAGELIGNSTANAAAPLSFGIPLLFAGWHRAIGRVGPEAFTTRWRPIVNWLYALTVVYAIFTLFSNLDVSAFAAGHNYRQEKAFLLVFGVALAIVLRSRARLLLICGLSVVLFFTYSAVTYLVVAASGLLVWLATRRMPVTRLSGKTLMFASGVLAAGFIVESAISGGFGSAQGIIQNINPNDSPTTRATLLGLAWSRIKESPLLGGGFAHSGTVQLPSGFGLLSFAQLPVHSDPIEIWMVGGAIALALWVAWIILINRHAFAALKLAADGVERNTITAMLVAFDAFIASSLSNPLSVELSQMVLLIIFYGLLNVAIGDIQRHAANAAPPVRFAGRRIYASARV